MRARSCIISSSLHRPQAPLPLQFQDISCAKVRLLCIIYPERCVLIVVVENPDMSQSAWDAMSPVCAK